MTREEIQAIAKEIVVWLSEEGFTFKQAGEIIETVRKSINYCTFDASNLLSDNNTQQLSSPSNQAQPCQQVSGCDSKSPVLIGLSLKSTTALRIGQTDIKDITSEEAENSITQIYAQHLIKIFADKKFSIEDILNILDHENMMQLFRKSILVVKETKN
jgi:hypothetical protein